MHTGHAILRDLPFFVIFSWKTVIKKKLYRFFLSNKNERKIFSVIR